MVPIEPDGFWRVIAIAAWTVVTALFTWIAKTLHDEQKSHGARLDDLERTYVSREELDRHVQRLEAASLRMHEDNKGSLIRIEAKIERGAQTRHDIKDAVGAMQLMLRAALKKGQQEDDTR